MPYIYLEVRPLRFGLALGSSKNLTLAVGDQRAETVMKDVDVIVQ